MCVSFSLCVYVSPRDSGLLAGGLDASERLVATLVMDAEKDREAALTRADRLSDKVAFLEQQLRHRDSRIQHLSSFSVSALSPGGSAASAPVSMFGSPLAASPGWLRADAGLGTAAAATSPAAPASPMSPLVSASASASASAVEARLRADLDTARRHAELVEENNEELRQEVAQLRQQVLSEAVLSPVRARAGAAASSATAAAAATAARLHDVTQTLQQRDATVVKAALATTQLRRGFNDLKAQATAQLRDMHAQMLGVVKGVDALCQAAAASAADAKEARVLRQSVTHLRRQAEVEAVSAQQLASVTKTAVEERASILHKLQSQADALAAASKQLASAKKQLHELRQTVVKQSADIATHRDQMQALEAEASEGEGGDGVRCQSVSSRANNPPPTHTHTH